MTDITDSLAAAFDRIDDFQAVQAGRSLDEGVKAVTLLQSAVGIEDESRRLFIERVERLTSDPHLAHVLLGVIVGLLAAQLEAERA